MDQLAIVSVYISGRKCEDLTLEYIEHPTYPDVTLKSTYQDFLTMMQLQDTDLLKEIPGYQAILRAVLKSQIQLLVEQLSDATGEESIILTASVNDGTLCHLGSTSGKDFLNGREEIKSQFLRHCLKKRHKLTVQDEDDTEVPHASKERRTMPSQSVSQGHSPGSTLQAPCDEPFPAQSPYQGETMNRGSSPRTIPVNRSTKGRMKRTPFLKVMNCPLIATQGHAGENIVKSELQDTEAQGDSSGITTTFGSTDLEQSDFSIAATQQASSQGTSDSNINKGSGVEPNIDSNLSTQSVGSDFASGTIVKEEATDDDLEITSIEPGMSVEGSQMSYQGDWAPDMSYGPGAMGGDGQSGMEMMNVGNQSQAEYTGYPGASQHGDSSGPHGPPDYPPNNDVPLQHAQRGKRFHCEICSKSFSTNGHLTRHMAAHLGVRYPCKLCPKTFSQKHQRKVHELMTHKQKVEHSE